MTVRPAAGGDIPALLDLLGLLHRESAFSDVPLSDSKLRAFVEHAIKNPRYCAFVDIGSDGSLQGTYIGKVDSYFFSDEIAAYDVIFYVPPGRRGSTAAARLWRAFERWAVRSGAKRVWPGVSTGIDPERAARFYKGVGLSEVGTVFTGYLG